MPRSRLATLLSLAILSCSALIFVAALAYQYQTSREAILLETARNAKNLTLATAHKIEVILKGVEKIPLTLATCLETTPPHQGPLINLIRRSLARNPDIFGIAVAFEPYRFQPQNRYFAPYVYRDQGQLKLTFLGDNAYDYFSWDWYQIPRELGRPVWSEPYYDENAGNIIMSTFSAPFYRRVGEEAEVQGIITADISLKWLQEIIAGVKIYQTGYAFLITHNGVFVTHPEERLIMKESIFSLAAAGGDEKLRRLGRDMIRGGSGFVSLKDFVSGQPSWLFYTPLAGTGWTLGLIFPHQEIFAELHQLSQKLLVIGTLGLILLSLVIVLLARSITSPLRRLTDSVAAIGQGDFSVSVPEHGAWEIARLSQAFNDLGAQLTDYIAKRDFIRDTFGRYVTQEVVKKLLESKEGLELGGETREVSILMSDLRGFTALTGDMEPQQVITFLNRYLGKMIEILLDHQAVIDEIIGDGILAFFGAPQPRADHPFQAVSCALKMQLALEEINTLNERDGLPHLEMGIAVNTGTVVVGNIGSEKRTKYGLVGAEVNFTGRMESYTVGGQVLISPGTYLAVQEAAAIRQQFQVEMKGLPEPVTLYDVQGLAGPQPLHLKERHDTLLPLPRELPVNVYRLREKVLVGPPQEARITHFCETTAIITLAGQLTVWENVRLHLLADDSREVAGKMYGKVVAVAPGATFCLQATIRFTSISPEVFLVIRNLPGENQKTGHKQ